MPNAFFATEMEGEVEAWKADYNRAMECRDLEDLLRRGIGVFYYARIGDESWTKKVQAGNEKFDADRARQIQEEYKGWLTPCEWVLGLVEHFERTYEVENAEHFRSCVRLARRLVAVDLEQLIESVAQLENGDVEPLTDEVWGGLQDHDHA